MKTLVIEATLVLALLTATPDAVGAAEPTTRAAMRGGPPAETSATIAPLPWWGRLRWAWLAGGVALGSAAAATLVSVHAGSLEGRYHDALSLSRTEPQPGSTVRGLGDEARQQALAANVLWGVTGALAITTGVLAYLEWTTPGGLGGDLVLAPAAMPGGAGLTFGGAF